MALSHSITISVASRRAGMCSSSAVPKPARPQGCDALAERAQAKLGVGLGDTTTDERVTLEPTYCLGLCAVAPSAMFDDRVIGRLDAKRLDALLEETWA